MISSFFRRSTNIYSTIMFNFDRWNIDDTYQVPDFIKIVTRFTLNVFDDYEREAAEQGNLFAIPYAKETVRTTN